MTKLFTNLHLQIIHPERSSDPKAFSFKVEGTFNFCLDRQMREGVLITYGEAAEIMNSKTECHQPRVTRSGDKRAELKIFFPTLHSAMKKKKIKRISLFSTKQPFMMKLIMKYFLPILVTRSQTSLKRRLQSRKAFWRYSSEWYIACWRTKSKTMWYTLTHVNCSIEKRNLFIFFLLFISRSNELTLNQKSCN